MSPSAARKTHPLVAQASSPGRHTISDHQTAPAPVVLHFPGDAADKLARTPVVHDLFHRDITLPGAPTTEELRLECRRATDFVSACYRDQRHFSSPEQAAHVLLAEHRNVAASLALAHAVMGLLEAVAADQQVN